MSCKLLLLLAGYLGSLMLPGLHAIIPSTAVRVAGVINQEIDFGLRKASFTSASCVCVGQLSQTFYGAGGDTPTIVPASRQ